MDKELSSEAEANLTTGRNLNFDEQRMLYVLRKERDDIIKQKGKDTLSVNNIQETIKVHEDEMQKVLKWQAELELEYEQLKAETDNNIQTKLINLENDSNNMKNRTIFFCEQLDQLKISLQLIEVNTEKNAQCKTEIFTDIVKYLDEQKSKEKIYEKQIITLQGLVNTEVYNNNKIIQEKELEIEKQKEELAQLSTTHAQQSTILDQGKTRNLQLQNELENIKGERKDLHCQYSKLKEEYTESIKKFNCDVTNYEDQKKTLEKNVEIEKERIAKIQSNIELLKQDHSRMNEQIPQAQTDLHSLKVKHGEMQEQVSNILTKLDEFKINLSNEYEEKKSEIVVMQEKLEQKTEINEKCKEKNKLIKEQLADKRKYLENCKEKLITKIQNNDKIITQLKDMKQKNKENGEKNEDKIIEFNEKINDFKIKNNQKRETNKNFKSNIADKQKLLSELEDKIQSVTHEKLSILAKKNSALKNYHDELKSLNKENQTLNSEMEKVNKSIDKKIKLSEKFYNDQTNKAKKDLNEYRETMNTIMVNENNKLMKEKRAEEESINTMLLQVTQFKSSKENLQEAIANKIQLIIDITNKIEAKNNEVHHNSDNSLKEKEFKSPTLPNKSTGKTKSTIITSSPISNLKNSSNKIHTTFTQKDVDDKQINISPIENNNGDDITNVHKNIPLTQKNENDKSEYKEKPTRKQSASLWPTDNETTDDSFNFKKKFSTTQKSDTKKVDLLKPITTKMSNLTSKKQSASLWPSDNETSDSNNFNKKNSTTQKSHTKKVEFLKPITTKISNLTSASNKNKNISSTQKSDDKNNVTSTQKPVERNVSQVEPEKKRTIFNFMDSEDENNDMFESIKINSNVKSTQKSNVDKFISTEVRKRSAPHFWTTENDSSDDSFFGKMDKSKKITSNDKRNSAAIINIDTSISD